MTDYIDPEDALPEMEYTEPKAKKRQCYNCEYSRVTNPGARIPGLCCLIMEEKFHKKGIENGMSQVDASFGVCKLHRFKRKRST